ncbi:unnamed protein product [Ectocarpus sp. 4 AP-2014]
MAPIFHQQQMDHHAHHAVWEDGRQARPGTHYPLQQHQHQHQHQHQQWPAQGRLHINPAMVRDDGFAAAPPMQQHHGSMSASRHHQPQQQPLGSSSSGREVLGEGSFMGRGYSIKRCQGFVRCDMDIDAEVVGWVIGKNGSTIKDMKHKTGCNMWVDQRALKLTITGPDLPSVEHAAKSVDAYVAAAPIKAGAVEAAVTKTIECPPQLLDDLGDRTTIARIVKETHAQVVVNKKIGRIIVRGDHRSVDLAYESVRAMIHNAVHGSYGLGLRVSTPDSHGSFGVASGGGGAGYFPDAAMSSSGRGGGGGGDMRSPLVSGAVAGAAAGMHHLMLPSTAGGAGGSSHADPDFHHLAGHDYRHASDTAEFHHLATWQQEQQQLELKPEHSHQPLQRHHHHNHGRGVGSDTDDSEIETVSLGSMGARTPVSSTAGSPRVAGSYNTSPALSGTASTPVGDWSLFSGGFGIGMAALQEGESSTSRSSTPTTARTTPRVHFPEGLRALVGGAGGASAASAASAGDLAVLKGSGLLSPASAADGNSGGSGSNDGGGKPAGSLAPPPSPASTAGGEASRRMAGLPVPEAQVLSALEGQGSDGEEKEEGQEGSAAAVSGGGEDISDKVARLGKVLQTMGLGKYCPKFAENEVDLEALGLMSESDLADIGIPKGPRLKILNAVGARAAAAANHAPAV